MRKGIVLLFTFASALLAAIIWANWPTEALSADIQVDRIVVWKSNRQLCLYAHDKLVKTYFVSLGHHPTGPKQIEGDSRTPEGNYMIEAHNPNSTCHKSLKISYPSSSDRASAAKISKSAGGDIMIHGILNGLGFFGRFHRFKDWTAGCIAVSDQEMNQIYSVVPDGTPIEIHP